MPRLTWGRGNETGQLVWVFTAVLELHLCRQIVGDSWRVEGGLTTGNQGLGFRLFNQLSLIDSDTRSNKCKNAFSSSLRFDGRLRAGLAFDI